jgi:hypothetical protein
VAPLVSLPRTIAAGTGDSHWLAGTEDSGSKPGVTDPRHKDSNTQTIANTPVGSPGDVELKATSSACVCIMKSLGTCDLQ